MVQFLVLLQVQKPKNEENHWCTFQSELEGRRRLISQLKDNQAETENSFSLNLLFYSGLYWIG